MRNELIKLKALYEKGTNIIGYLKEQAGKEENTCDSIAISYDFQAGAYVKKAAEYEKFENERARTYSELINTLGSFKSLVEVGVGEATTFANIIPRLHSDFEFSLGFDISYSRLMYGRQHLKDISYGKLDKTVLFMGDLFRCPIQDNSIDLVYTNHSLEPNGGREVQALKELYRITKKYLVLFEPIYELASSKAKSYMDRHGYVKNLYSIAKEQNYKVLEFKLLYDDNPFNSNNTGVLVIEKINEGGDQEGVVTLPLACPVTQKTLDLVRGHYFCRQSLLLYPVIDSIPCLLPDNAIIATHYGKQF